MRFRILGPLEVAGDPGPATAGLHTPGPAKLRVVLGTLLVRANEVVSVDSLVDELWRDAPPRTAMTTLHVYVSQIRKALRSASTRHGEGILLTRRPGYLLRAAPDELDLAVFEDLRERGRKALAGHDDERAAALLRQAQDLWRGPLLSGVPYGPLLESAAARLTEARLEALEQRVHADLRLGRDRELVAELRALVSTYPLREELHAHLMTALFRSGRLAEALQAYAAVRRTLIEELGVEPGVRLRRLHEELLRADGDPLPAFPAAPVALSAAPAAGNTDWLPPDDGPPAGRDAERVELVGRLRDARPGSWVAITGLPGSGKTALAVAAAREAATAFPDGVLFLDLAPDGGPVLAPAEAAARLLRRARAVASEAGRTPEPDGDPLEALRTFTAGRRLLFVLDNARSVAQVRPLLPTTPGSAAVVTGRLLPAGAPGMHSLRLGLLGRTAAAEVLAGAGPVAAEEIAALCGRLPLALRAAAVQLKARPHWTGEVLAARLRDETSRLDALRIGEFDVRARLTAAYDELPAAGRRAFRLLGLLPAAGFPLVAAAAVLDLATAEAAPLVESLCDRQLLLAPGPDTYVLPELLRVLAAELLAAREPVEAVRAATSRMCAAYAAAAAEPGGGPTDAEGLGRYAGLVRAAHGAGLWAQTILLADTVTGALERAAAWDDWEGVHTLALDAARRVDDRRAEARMLRSLGDLAWQQRMADRAAERYARAARAATAAGAAAEAARALAGLAELRLEGGLVAEADALLTSARHALATGHARPGAGRFEVRRVEALLALETGAGADAAGALADCVALARALGDRHREAYARRALGNDAASGAGSGRAVEVRPGIWRLRCGTPR
ncbi:AfsR/SARP family transcriptional regulator [Streptomyces sp. A1136]|uniref:AfsR/SARP family transcriptional regulator n=1 Tax=Streptomyces sp. A1136 TaxID=2563102 RepID=UPI00109EB364|nr:AfsR/SARP family transcriptional regulator [Streptomyces sp. A1136]THA54604.1 AfsR/SARP family transcriptional regulator [Streptomyces sp. A1136]